MYTMDDTGVSATTWKKLYFAANRGVKIVCAVDAIKNEVSKETMEKMKKFGDQCKFIKYNTPTKYLSYLRQGRTHQTLSRHHEKIVIADSNVFIGSGNMKGEYGGPLLGTNMFRDVYAIIKNGPTQGILEFMKSTVDVKDYNYIPSGSNSNFPNDRLDYYKDEDEKFEFLFEAPGLYSEIKTKLPKLISSAKHRVIVVQPYFQLVPRLTQAMLQARRRGVRVTIITARDKDLLIYNYVPNYILMRPLINAGCEVYENTAKFLHTKFHIIDNKHFSLGIIAILIRRIV